MQPLWAFAWANRHAFTLFPHRVNLRSRFLFFFFFNFDFLFPLIKLSFGTDCLNFACAHRRTSILAPGVIYFTSPDPIGIARADHPRETINPRVSPYPGALLPIPPNLLPNRHHGSGQSPAGLCPQVIHRNLWQALCATVPSRRRAQVLAAFYLDIARGCR